MKAGWLVATGLLGASAAGYTQAAAHSQATQKPFGSVAVGDATVVGAPNEAFQLVSGRAQLNRTATVTAKPGHNADVALARGGSVLVCQSTALHLTSTNTASNDNSLLLALDRGAMEIRMKASVSDVVMTPDLRFTLSEAGPLDLQMRVTFNGDTCVENHGNKAPALNITDAFGETAYLLKSGQHVMFEHGSLRTVMDRETTPCGCPPPEKPGMSLADAMLRGGQNTTITPQQAAEIHPFPAAQSDGLAAPPPAVPETPGERHVQVASTLIFDPNAPTDAKATITAGAPARSVAPPPPKATHKGGPFAAIGRFFKHLFVR
jgi:hypothetical protein